MRFRKFLLSLRLFVRYRTLRRRFGRICRSSEAEKAKNIKDTKDLTKYYERRLEVERQKIESLLFVGVDRAYQAMKLLPVSHVTRDARENAQNVLHPPDMTPPDPEKSLSGDELAFFLDAKDGFWEAEAENGRSDAEIQRIWDSDYRQLEIARAKSSLI